ncbi:MULTISPECIES: sensor domain-containing protein [Mycolicibacterium]|uniref:sensor domain-containing protein n=1 Tax=Mycolicibacterium TaxID=1866885 RepID=UPI001F16A92C|nr:MULTISPECIES: sensor domain-containing protein [Mycolicibacterium]
MTLAAIVVTVVALALVAAAVVVTVSGIGNVPPAVLDGLLLTPQEVAKAHGAQSVEVVSDDDTLDSKEPDSECLGLLNDRSERAYRGSGWSAVRHQTLADEQRQVTLSQSVIAMRDTHEAARFVDGQNALWETCSTQVLQRKNKDGLVADYVVTMVKRSDGILAASYHDEGDNGWTCVRGMAWRRNVVIDTTTCGPGPTPWLLPGIIVPISARIQAA